MSSEDDVKAAYWWFEKSFIMCHGHEPSTEVQERKLKQIRKRLNEKV